jgi:nitrogen fixation-related uncharacterized protein
MALPTDWPTFVLNSSPAIIAGAAGVLATLWRIYRERHDDVKEDRNDERRIFLEDEVKARDKAEIIRVIRELAESKRREEKLEAENDKLWKQHDYDNHSVMEYQFLLRVFTHEIVSLRASIDEMRKEMGKPAQAWPPLPPTPQPDLGKKDDDQRIPE